MPNRSSAQIANRDAIPSVLNNASNGPVNRAFSSVGLVGAVLTVDVIGNVYRMMEVPTNCRVSSVRLWCTALGGSTAADVGVYRNTRDGGAVVDADLFASAQSLVSAVNGTEISNESTVYTLARREQPLWQAAGLASDPGGTFDICCTLTAAVTASGTVLIEVAGSLP
jgi:hypothetical protein